MLVQKMNKAEECAEEEELPREIEDELGCKCLFWRRYQLPCRHIFYQHMLFQILSDDDWETFAFAWEECGFEKYETASPQYAIKEVYEEIGAPAKRKLEFREVLDNLHAKYYWLEDQMNGWPDDARDTAIKGWITALEQCTGELRKQAADDLISRLTPQQAEAVRESQLSPQRMTQPLYMSNEMLSDSEFEGA
jgi:hypothetical protein